MGFAVGDRVRCLEEDGQDLVRGEIYTVRGTISYGNEPFLQLAGLNRMQHEWFASRFEHVKPTMFEIDQLKAEVLALSNQIANLLQQVDHQAQRATNYKKQIAAAVEVLRL